MDYSDYFSGTAYGSNEDVKVGKAGNGHEGIEMLRILSYDLVFMDCQMPEMDGYEATAEIRALEHPTCRIPIVAMTADALAEVCQRCLAAGMDDVIIKPVKIEDFAQALETWLRLGPVDALAERGVSPEPLDEVRRRVPTGE